ncbi:MAG: CHAT domain-containing tetratricopeptide repeat protein [Saprospiraceae bacterium]
MVLLCFNKKSVAQERDFIKIDSLIKVRLHTEALQIITNLKKNKLYSTPYFQLKTSYLEGFCWMELGQYRRSRDLTDSNMSFIYDNHSLDSLLCKNVLLNTKALTKLTEINTGINECSKAIRRLSQNQNKYKVDIVDLLIKKGQVQRLNKNFEESIATLDEAAELIKSLAKEKLKSKRNQALLYTKATIYARTNRMKESIDIANKLLPIVNENKDSSKIMATNTLIAVAYFHLGNYGRSRYHMIKSTEIKLKIYGENDPRMLSDYGNLGVSNMQLGYLDEALSYFDKVHKIIINTMGPESQEMGSLLLSEAEIHLKKKEYKIALDKNEQSLHLARKLFGDNHYYTGEILQKIGIVHFKMGNMSEANINLEKALKIRELAKDINDPNLTELYCSLAKLNIKMNRINQATRYVNLAYNSINYEAQKAFQFSDLSSPLALTIPLSIDINAATKRYIDSKNENDYLVIERKAEIADSIINFTKYQLDDPKSRMISFKNNRALYENLMMVYHARHDHSKDGKAIYNAFSILERSKNALLFEKIGSVDSEKTLGVPNYLIDNKMILEDSIALFENKCNKLKGQELVDCLQNLNRTKGNYYDIIKMMKIEYPNYFDLVYDYPITDLKKYATNVKANESLLSYFKGEEYIYGILINSEYNEFKKIAKTKTIDSLISIFLKEVKTKNSPSLYIKNAKILYEKLIQPFNINTTFINIVTDGSLGLIPFELLINPTTNSSIISTHTIAYQYSATQQNKRKRDHNKTNLLAMAPVFELENQKSLYVDGSYAGEDVFRNNLNYLPESAVEISTIKSLLGGTTYAKDKATEEVFKQFAPKSNILHLATHGYVNHSNPDNSRLYFYSDSSSTEDGILYAYEIANMDLNADLVTLSACNTGVGKIQDGEGVASLGRAFAYANCPNQLISLWPVNDNSTTQLMSIYYNNIKKGLGKSTALAQAKREYVENAPQIFKHPYYWAGFVYYGDDKPLELKTSFPWFIATLSLLGIGMLGIYFKDRK